MRFVESHIYFNFMYFLVFSKIFSKISSIVPSLCDLKISLERKLKSTIGRSYFMPKRVSRIVRIYDSKYILLSLQFCPCIPDFMCASPPLKSQACNMRLSFFSTFQAFFSGNFSYFKNHFYGFTNAIFL